MVQKLTVPRARPGDPARRAGGGGHVRAALAVGDLLAAVVAAGDAAHVGAALDRLARVRAALDRRLVFPDDAARRVPAEDIPFIPAVPDPHRRVLRLARDAANIFPLALDIAVVGAVLHRDVPARAAEDAARLVGVPGVGEVGIVVAFGHGDRRASSGRGVARHARRGRSRRSRGGAGPRRPGRGSQSR